MGRETVDPLPILRDPARLAAVQRTGLLDTPPEAAFDRLTRLTSRLLRAPVALLTLVADERQFFKSSVGLSEPWASRRESPLTHSFCQYTVALGEPFIVDDAYRHPLVRDNLAVTALNIVAYAGVPLMSGDGQALGSLCVCDSQPRAWTDDDLTALQDLAALALTEIERRMQVAKQQEGEAALQAQRDLWQMFIDNLPDPMVLKDAEGRYLISNLAFKTTMARSSSLDITGKLPDEVLPEEVAARVRADDETVLRTGQPIYNLEEVVVGPDGARTWGLISKVPLRDADGHIIGTVGISRDISERKLAEQALQESEERHRIVFELTSDNAYAFAVQPDGKLTLEWAMGSIVEATGYTWEEMAGTFSLYHPDDAARVRADVQKTIAGEQTQGEYRIITKSGETRWSEIRRYPVYDEAQQRVVRFYGLARDISERKRTEAALRESEARYRAISELMSDTAFAYQVHPDGTFTLEWVMGSFLSDAGYTSDEIGSTLRLYHSDDAERVAADLQAVLAGQTINAEYRIVTKEGEIRWAESYRTPEIVDGRVVRFYGAARDITQRKRTEAALRESEARFSGILSMIHEAIVSIDEDQRIMIFNTGAEQVFGYSTAEVLGQPLNRLLPEDSRARHVHHLENFAVSAVAARRMGERGEIYGRRKDGQLFPAEASISKLQLGGRTIFTAVLRDVSERKLAEQALQESEARFRQLAENLNQVFWVRDAHSQGLLYISPAYQQIWGRAPDVLYTRLDSFMETIHPDDRQRMRETYARQGRSGYDVEYRIVRPDGTIRWIWSRSIPVRDAQGEVYRVVGIADDITERKQAVDALRESDERFRQLAENLDQVFWMRDAESDEVLYVSPAYEQVWGRSLDDLSVDPHSFDAVHPDDRAWVRAVYDKQKKAGYDIEYRTIHPDGSLHWTRSRAFPVRNAQGEVYRIAGIAEDITARKLVEAAYRDLVENALQGIMVMQDGRIVFANAAWAQVVGYTLEELLALEDPLVLIHPDDVARIGDYLKRRLAGDSVPSRYELRMIRKDGGVCWLEQMASLVMYRGKPATQTSSMDISERKQAEARQMELLLEREKLDTLSRFIGDMSHDLRTPLSVIKTSTYLLGKQPDPEKRGRYLANLDAQVTHIERVLHDMLTMTRLDGMGLDFARMPQDLNALVAELVELTMPMAQEAQLDLRYVRAAKPVKVQANSELLGQALRQLLVNAVNYTVAGGQVEVMVKLEGGAASVSVRDTGIGITQDDLAYIFNAFYRADKARNTDTGGSGLGLTIAKKIVELHGGTIDVESSVGAGSTFTFRLPLEH